MMPNEFDGQAFRKARRAADITQAELATLGEAAGLRSGQTQISKIECEDQHIRGWQTIETYRRIIEQKSLLTSAEPVVG